MYFSLPSFLYLGCNSVNQFLKKSFFFFLSKSLTAKLIDPKYLVNYLHSRGKIEILNFEEKKSSYSNVHSNLFIYFFTNFEIKYWIIQISFLTWRRNSFENKPLIQKSSYWKKRVPIQISLYTLKLNIERVKK